MASLRRQLAPRYDRGLAKISPEAGTLRAQVAAHAYYDAATDEAGQRAILKALDELEAQDLKRRREDWEQAKAKGHGHIDLLPTEVLNLIFWHLREMLRDKQPRERHSTNVTYRGPPSTAAETLRRLIPTSPRFAPLLRALYWQEIDYNEVFPNAYERRVKLFETVGPLVENLRIPLDVPIEYLTSMRNLKQLDISLAADQFVGSSFTMLRALFTMLTAISTQLESLSFRALGHGHGEVFGPNVEPGLLPATVQGFTSLRTLRLGQFELGLKNGWALLKLLAGMPSLRRLGLYKMVIDYDDDEDPTWNDGSSVLPVQRLDNIEALHLDETSLMSPLVRAVLRGCGHRLQKLSAGFLTSGLDAFDETRISLPALDVMQGNVYNIISLMESLDSPALSIVRIVGASDPAAQTITNLLDRLRSFACLRTVNIGGSNAHRHSPMLRAAFGAVAGEPAISELVDEESKLFEDLCRAAEQTGQMLKDRGGQLVFAPTEPYTDKTQPSWYDEVLSPDFQEAQDMLGRDDEDYSHSDSLGDEYDGYDGFHPFVYDDDDEDGVIGWPFYSI